MSSIESASDDRGPGLRALLIVWIPISTLVVVLRFWSRALSSSRSMSKRGPRFWWDDWMALLALPFCIATCSLGIYLIHLGLGRHFSTIPPERQTLLLKVLWATYYVYDTGISLAKSSALLFYARIFGTSDKRFKYALWTMQFVVFGWLFGILISVVFTCIPVQKSWIPTLDGKCQKEQGVWLGSALSSVVIDLVILLMPLPMLWRLQMKRGQKILVCAVFVCGYCIILVSLGRLVSILKAGSALDADVTWRSVPSIYWLGSESPISVISICLPSMFFIARQTYREGVTSLFRKSSTSSRARLHGSSRKGTEAGDHNDDASVELAIDRSLSSKPDSLEGKTSYTGPHLAGQG